jgi:hypothetical protein
MYCILAILHEENDECICIAFGPHRKNKLRMYHFGRIARKARRAEGAPDFVSYRGGSGPDTKLYPAKQYTFDALGVDNIKRRICPVLHF